MSKKVLFVFVLFIFMISDVKAEEVFYSNEEVSLTKKEYDYISYMYFEGYQKFLDKNDYDTLINDQNLDGEKDIKIYYDNDLSMYDLSHSTTSKRIKIAKNCSSECTIAVTLTWLKSAKIHSYDVMGAYLNNVTLVSNPITKITLPSLKTFNTAKRLKNGFGQSFILPTGSNVSITQTFNVTKGGYVNASYQHAKSTISLANSQNYTLSNKGYGGVFNFGTVGQSIYDKMGGVSINV